MKRNQFISLLALSLLLDIALPLAGCTGLYGAPDSISNGEKSYLTGFYGEMIPQEFSRTAQTITVNGEDYRRVKHKRFELYHGYVGLYSNGTIYCAEDQFEEASLYYADPENFTYHLVVGNPVTVSATLKDVDYQRFEELLDFVSKNAYDPFDPLHNSLVEKVTLPMPEDYGDGEIHFFKTSKDDLFTTEGNTFHIVEDEMYLLFYYDGGADSDGIEKMIAVKLPEELSEYFVPLVQEHL